MTGPSIKSKLKSLPEASSSAKTFQCQVLARGSLRGVAPARGPAPGPEPWAHGPSPMGLLYGPMGLGALLYYFCRIIPLCGPLFTGCPFYFLSVWVQNKHCHVLGSAVKVALQAAAVLWRPHALYSLLFLRQQPRPEREDHTGKLGQAKTGYERK